MKNKILIGILAVIIVVAVLVAVFFFRKDDYNLPVDPSGASVTYTVEEGSTPQVIASDLEEKKIIRSADFLEGLFVESNGVIYVNKYEVSPAQTTKEIYEIITNPISNVTDGNALTIYEGEQINQIADAVSSQLDMSASEVLGYWNAKNTISELSGKYSILDNKALSNTELVNPLEGYLYPATYEIDDDETLESLTNKILDTSQENYGKYASQKNKSGLSFQDSLALASIVERETMTDDDKYKVAGVFYNRLDQNMKLQSDITVLYGKGEHKEIVTYEDLEYDSPYNTYMYEGIPPGAIASPSLTAVDAVYNADNNDYLYFFAKQDTGEVLYSKTLEEHEKISEEYAWK